MCPRMAGKAVAALVLAAASLSPAFAQNYVLTDLGAMAGGPSTAMDISPNGRITGAANTGVWNVCLWTPSGGSWTFQNLGLPSGANYGQGLGVNDSSQV